MTGAAPARRRPPTLIEVAEWAFFTLALMLMTEALLGPLFDPDQSKKGPEWLRLVWPPIYAGCVGVAMLRAPRMGSVWITAASVGALVLLAFASERWSVAPEVTQRRSIALLFTSFMGLVLAARYDWRGLVQLFAGMFVLLAVASLLVALLYPTMGVHATIHPGAWRGVWYEKNQFGALMAWGALACTAAAVLGPERRWRWAAAATLCVFLVLMSTSKTSLLGLLLGLSGAGALALLRRGGAVAVGTVWLAVLGGAVVVGLAVFAPEIMLEALGKDPTLTGRTDIWASLMRRVAERPWTGYGYAAFWVPDLGPAWYIREEIQWEAPSAHNGWLEVLVQLGWPGLVLTVLLMTASFVAALIRIHRPEATWGLMALALMILFSLSESTLLQQNNISWVLYVATTAKLFQLGRRTRYADDRGRAQAVEALAFVGAGWRRPAAASLRWTSAEP